MHAPLAQPPATGRAVADVLAGADRAARRRRLVSRLVWIVVILALGAGGLVWWEGRSEPTTVYATRPIERGGLVVTVTATGTLEPTNTVEVSSELSGTVRRVLVDYNDPVRKGGTIAELDTDRLAVEVTAAEAKLAAARAGVAEARATIAEKKGALDRKVTLLARRVVTDQEVDSARADHDRALAALTSAEAQVEVAAADLAVARTNLTKASILSPIDGVVLTRAVEPGQTVAASLQAPVLFTLAEDLKRMQLGVDVDEADVGRVAEGQPATFTVDAYPGRSFPARIRSIRYASETTQGVVTYKAVLDVDNADLALRPGMTATAEIEVERDADALLVPAEALRWAPDPVATTSGGSLLSRILPRPPRPGPTRTDQDGRTLYLLRDGVPTAVPVEIGGSDGQKTVVRGAVAAGDPVVVDATTSK